MSPIIVDPSFVPPPPPATATSSDGYLTATLDPAHAGVILKANFSSLGTVPVKVRFYRDGVLVRSGDPAWAPGGIAIAYDHEVPVGATSSWTAVPILASGALGTSSTPVALTVPAPSGSLGWLKSIISPDLSMLVTLASAAEGGRDLRADLASVPGSPFPVGSWDVPTALTITIGIRTDTAEDYDAIVALVSAGAVLFQGNDTSGIPRNLYALPTGSLAAARMAGAETGFGWEFRLWSLTLTEIARPATIDAPLRIPGLSWETTADSYASWSTLTAAKSSWAALLGA